MTSGNYQAYLLRMQHVRDEHWIFSLQDPNGQIMHRFQSLEALVQFLKARHEVMNQEETHQKGNE